MTSSKPSLRQISNSLGISTAYLSYMVNGKRPWRVDLKEAYDRSIERGLPVYPAVKRDTAESGRAPAWGVGGRRFESDHPDQKNKAVNEPMGASVNSFYVSRDTLKLADVVYSFIHSSTHK